MANNIVEEPGEDKEGANLAVANRKRAIFLTEIGPEAYSTLSNLLAPLKPKDTPSADIVKASEKHYNPAPLEIAESSFWNSPSGLRGIYQRLYCSIEEVIDSL